MKKDQTSRTVQAPTTLYLALELSNTKWKLAFSNGSKNRFVTIDALDLKRFHQEVDESRKRLGVSQ